MIRESIIAIVLFICVTYSSKRLNDIVWYLKYHERHGCVRVFFIELVKCSYLLGCFLKDTM